MVTREPWGIQKVGLKHNQVHPLQSHCELVTVFDIPSVPREPYNAASMHNPTDNTPQYFQCIISTDMYCAQWGSLLCALSYLILPIFCMIYMLLLFPFYR